MKHSAELLALLVCFACGNDEGTPVDGSTKDSSTKDTVSRDTTSSDTTGDQASGDTQSDTGGGSDAQDVSNGDGSSLCSVDFSGTYSFSLVSESSDKECSQLTSPFQCTLSQKGAELTFTCQLTPASGVCTLDAGCNCSYTNTPIKQTFDGFAGTLTAEGPVGTNNNASCVFQAGSV